MPDAITSNAYMNAFGVNIHASYTNTTYANSAEVITLLKNLHIRHVRDGLYPWAATDPAVAFHASLKAASISSIAVVANGIFKTADQIVTICKLLGNIEALECMNEPDVDPSLSSWTTAVTSTLAIVRAAADTLGIPVIAPALVKNDSAGTLGQLRSPGFDIGNIHAYFGGRNPETAAWGPNQEFTMSWCHDHARWLVNTENIYITETGYIVPESGTIQPYQLPQGPAAVYSIRTILEALRAGFQRVYFYELLDQSATGDGYGIVSAKFVPKLAYTAIRHMQELIGDWTAKVFTPGSLEYSVPPNYHSLLVEQQNGVFWIFAWPTDPVYNPATNAAVTPTQLPCTSMFSLDPAGGYKISLLASIGESGALAEVAVDNQSLTSWMVDDGSVVVAKVVKHA